MDTIDLLVIKWLYLLGVFYLMIRLGYHLVQDSRGRSRWLLGEQPPPQTMPGKILASFGMALLAIIAILLWPVTSPLGGFLQWWSRRKTSKDEDDLD